MRIWQAGDKWYVNDGTAIERTFNTEYEARTTMAKVDTAKAIVKAVQSLATATDSATDLVAEYWDTGTYADEDVAALGITAANLTSCITLLEQVDKLMTNQVTCPSQYRTTLNLARRISA